MDTYGYIWIHMDTYGYVLIHMDMYGYVWICMDTHGYIWILLDIYGYMDIWIYGYIIISRYRNTWIYGQLARSSTWVDVYMAPCPRWLTMRVCYSKLQRQIIIINLRYLYQKRDANSKTIGLCNFNVMVSYPTRPDFIATSAYGQTQ